MEGGNIEGSRKNTNLRQSGKENHVHTKKRIDGKSINKTRLQRNMRKNLPCQQEFRMKKKGKE